MKAETKRLIEDFMIALVISVLVMSWHKKKTAPEKPTITIENVRDSVAYQANNILQNTR